MKILIYLLIPLLFSISLFSQNQIQYKPSDIIKFEHLNENNGLSNNDVTCILQDSKGYMWFGTQDGLNKYDGQNFVIFKTDPGDSTSIAQNYITTLFEDKTGTLWIGTRTKSNKGKLKGGLNKFIRDKEQFVHYVHEPFDSLSISNNYINSVFEDDAGMIWIATMNGLNKFNPEKQEFIKFDIVSEFKPDSYNARISSIIAAPYEGKNNLLVATLGDGLKIFDIKKEKFHDFIPKKNNRYYDLSAHIKTICENDKGLIWLGTEYGLIRFDYESKKLRRYVNNPNDLFSLSNDRVRVIYEDNSGILWIGTLNGGLNKFNRENETFTRYTHDPNNPFSLNHQHVRSIFQDKSGVMWVGTNKGVNKFFNKKDPFIHYKHNPDYTNSLSDNRIWTVLEDKEGIIWIGTSKGLNKFNPQKEQFIKLNNDINGLNRNRIWSIYEDDIGVIWFGSKYGLIKLDNTTGKIEYYKNDPNNRFSLSSDNIKTIFKDNTGTLWIGTSEGLNRYDYQKKNFFRYKNDPKNPFSISTDFILSIHDSNIDGKNVLWIGTEIGGLNKFDRENNRFYRYLFDQNNSKSLSNNTVWKIYNDKKGELWCLTRNGLNRYLKDSDNFMRYGFGEDKSRSDVCKSIIEDKTGNLWIGNNFGLFKYDRNKDKFMHYNQKYEIGLERVDAIVVDDNGNLWLSSDDLITKFNPELMDVKNYKIEEGIDNIKLILHPNLKFSDGKILFSGLNGFVLFDPLSIEDNSSIPNIAITDFQIFNKSVEIKKNESPDIKDIVYLDKHISETNVIKIPYDKNVFSIEFSSLDFRNPKKNKYAYKLDGIDPEWVYTDASRRFATYNHLNPGEYTFFVKGSNNDGIWNDEGTSLKIIITPLWWQAIWFRVSLIAVIIGIIGYIFYNRITALKKKQQIQEEFSRQLIESQESERKRIATALHDSHGQNLLVISNEVQYFVNKHQIYKKELTPVTKIVQESIDEIRAISYDLHPHQLDKLGLVKTINSMVKKIGNSSDIKFNLNIDNVDGLFDKKVEINIYRIIQEATNNIIKHAQATEVNIEIKKQIQSVSIEIIDNGKGFDKKEKLKESTGLGLSGMQERAKLVKGIFKLSSELGIGTKIEIRIPFSA